jgi:hypothetical protein
MFPNNLGWFLVLYIPVYKRIVYVESSGIYKELIYTIFLKVGV